MESDEIKILIRSLEIIEAADNIVIWEISGMDRDFQEKVEEFVRDAKEIVLRSLQGNSSD